LHANLATGDDIQELTVLENKTAPMPTDPAILSAVSVAAALHQPYSAVQSGTEQQHTSTHPTFQLG